MDLELYLIIYLIWIILSRVVIADRVPTRNFNIRADFLARLTLTRF